jgi:predicted ferric reductase
VQTALTPRLILFIIGVGTPVLTTFLTYLPFLNRLIASVKPYVIYPALFHGRNVQAYWRWCHFPTTGQSIFIFMFTAITTTLTAAGYESVQPNTWYATRFDEIESKVAARTGVIAMGLAPLVLLFAGRNSVLLWMTNWSHSTYILLHRWIARLFGIQVILHSILELDGYVKSESYAENLVMPYWIWGCVGTVACSIMLVHSVFRNSSYEIFLIIHIVLAVFVLAGTWYHLDYRFEDRWGYKYWLYACFAIWAFDRVMRVGRMVKNGRRKASFRPVGDEILRVDIEGIKWGAKPGQHAYIFFPMLRKPTPWENHPFSVIPTNYLRPVKPLTGRDIASSGSATPAETPLNEKELEGLTPTSSATLEYSKNPTSGITFFIKKNNGLTKHLFSNTLITTTLIEGPYNSTSTRPVLLCDRLILVAGGIGITAVLPFAHAHPNVKIFWSMRDSQAAMVKGLQPGLSHIEQDIIVGKRLDIAGLIEREVEGGWKDLGVVVCGPGQMCDVLRKEVVRVSKEKKVRIELDVEAFSW